MVGLYALIPGACWQMPSTVRTLVSILFTRWIIRTIADLQCDFQDYLFNSLCGLITKKISTLYITGPHKPLSKLANHRWYYSLRISRCVTIITRFHQWNEANIIWSPNENEGSLLDKRYGVDDINHSHYGDVIMTTIASQITSLTVVYSIVYSDADQRKHQSSASLAFVWGIHRDRWIPRTKGQLRGKCFHLMTSSCSCLLVVNVACRPST